MSVPLRRAPDVASAALSGGLAAMSPFSPKWRATGVRSASPHDGPDLAPLPGKSQLIPDTKVEMTFERRRPPLEMTQASQALAKHSQRIYGEIGKTLVIGDVAEGGGTDAAFAALKTKAPVIERFGLRGFGAHSNDAEYVEINSIEPRLYLAARMIMDVAQGKHE